MEQIFQPNLDKYEAKDKNGRNVTVYNSKSDNMVWKRAEAVVYCNECHIVVKTVLTMEDPNQACALMLLTCFLVIFLNVFGFLLILIILYGTDSFPDKHICPSCGLTLGTTRKKK